MMKCPLLLPDQGPPGTQSIGRAAQLLRCIAAHGKRGIRIDGLVQLSGLSKTTCVRTLHRLIYEGLVYKNIRTEKFYLGPLLSELGALTQPRYQLEEVCELAMRTLSELTQDTVYLSERSENEAVCTARRMGSYPIKVVTQDVGIRMPLGVGPGGIAILAVMPSTQREAAVAANAQLYPKYDGLTLDRVVENAATTAVRGFYVGPSFGVRGTRTVSMGFYRGETVGALSVSALTNRMQPKRQDQIASLLAQQIALMNSSGS